MRRRRLLTALAAAALLGLAERAGALTLSLEPALQSVPPGPVVLTLVASGLDTDVVGAFDLDLSFDTARLALSSVDFGSALGTPGAVPAELISSFSAVGGTLDLAAISLLGESDLDARQGDSITLATITFEALAPGGAVVAVVLETATEVDDGAGIPLDIEAAIPATIEIVPEPGATVLLGSGLAGLAGLGRRRGRARA
jgi:hypothetical protein